MNTDQMVLWTNQSMTGSASSPQAPLRQSALASIQATWTGSPVGTLKLQISNDINVSGPSNANGFTVTNWSDYTGSSTAVSGAGNFTWNMVYVGFAYVRLVYTASSGTGSISANITVKG